jgi:LmbE family N-acetylglucosaminyl deacetylase
MDDVALSCGGLVWEQTQAGLAVSIWTICAGDPPSGGISPFAKSLHTRWETPEQAAEKRRAEDRAAARRLGAVLRQFPIPDCIYRKHSGVFLYDSEESLWEPLHPDEAGLVEALHRDLAGGLPSGARLVCPLALGNHVDHQLTRAAIEGLSLPIWYYPDYPYVLEEGYRLEALQEAGWRKRVFPVSEAGVQAWLEAVSAYHSQISTFWESEQEMGKAIRDYARQQGGVALWQPPG